MPRTKTKPVTKKNKTTASGSKTPKKNPTNKRGRRPKKILEKTDIEEKPVKNTGSKSKVNNSAVILRLNIDPTKLIGAKKKISKKNKSNDDSEDSSDDLDNEVDSNCSDHEDLDDDIEKTPSSEGMFRNDIPRDSNCSKCSKNEKRIVYLENELDKFKKRDKNSKKNKVYVNKINFISLGNNKKITIKKTNQKCLWDSHPFDDYPCFLPEIYHDGKYYITGCFCSFNCALAHNLYYLKDSKIYHRKSLVFQLYKEIHGISADEVIEIKEAPPREMIEDFGGTMSIDEFRKTFSVINKEYIVYMPPIKPINIYIEERNTDDNQDDDDKEFVLKRSKPLSKKKSIMSSMKMTVEDD